MTAANLPAYWNPQAATLQLDWSGLLGHPCQLHLGSWSSGLRASVVADDEREALELPRVGDWLLHLDEPAVLQWKQSIPQPVLKGLEHVPGDQLALLSLARRIPAVADLLHTSPLLMWALYRDQLAEPLADSQWRDRLSARQTALVRHLGLDGTRQQAKILQRAAGQNLTATEVAALLEVLQDKRICDYLSHQQPIRRAELRLLHQHPWIASCRARAVLPALNDPVARRDFKDTIQLLDELGPLMQCRSINEVRHLHERLVGELNRRSVNRLLVRDEGGRVLPFPAPPLAGTDRIVPICDQRTLINEGQQMQHCIASYIRRVLAGTYYVYEGRFAERVTIGIAIDPVHGVYIGDVRGGRNVQSSADTLAQVAAWFNGKGCAN